MLGDGVGNRTRRAQIQGLLINSGKGIYLPHHKGQEFPWELASARLWHHTQARTGCGSLNIETEKIGRRRKRMWSAQGALMRRMLEYKALTSFPSLPSPSGVSHCPTQEEARRQESPLATLSRVDKGENRSFAERGLVSNGGRKRMVSSVNLFPNWGTPYWVNKERNVILELSNHKRWVKEDILLIY